MFQIKTHVIHIFISLRRTCALILMSNFLVSGDSINAIKLAGLLNSIHALIRQTVIKLTPDAVMDVGPISNRPVKPKHSFYIMTEMVNVKYYTCRL